MQPVSLLLLLACVEDAEVHTSSTADDSGDTDWFVAPVVTPVLAAEEVEAEGERALREGMIFPLELPVWVDELLAEFKHDDRQDCVKPMSSLDQPDTWTLYGRVNCTGAVHDLAGYWLLESVHQQLDPGTSQLRIVQLYSFWGELVATGEAVEGGGAVQMSVETSSDLIHVASEHGGHFVDPAFAGLLAGGVSGSVRTEGFYRRQQGFDGTIEGSVEGGGARVDLQDIRFTPGCTGPVGTLAVRDPSSGWWTIELDASCSGCGPLTWQGEVRGESCLGVTLAGVVTATLDGVLDNPP